MTNLKEAMAEEYKVGLFAIGSVAAVAGVIAWVGGPVWYAVGPAIVYAAYFIKLRVRGLRDKPSTMIRIVTVVSPAMIVFAVV
jgi:hypothetical protein